MEEEKVNADETPAGLTPTQQKTVDFLRATVSRIGRPPTLSEIGAEFGITKDGAMQRLAAVRSKGAWDQPSPSGKTMLVDPGTPGFDNTGRVVSAKMWLELFRRKADRFWALVPNRPENGCWLWAGGKTADGYGKFSICGPMVNGKPQQRHVRAHRLAYELHKGPVSSDVPLLHSCDVRNCVNPAHLRPGTPAENSADCRARNRYPRGDDHWSHHHPHLLRRGEANHAAILTEAEVIQARLLRDTGLKAPAIAAAIGVSVASIRRAIYGRTWKHVQEIT